MPISSLASPPRFAFLAALQRPAVPQPSWGVALGAFLALLIVGSTPVLSLLLGLWELLATQLLPSASRTLSIRGTGIALWLAAAWAVVGGCLGLCLVNRQWPRHLALTAAAGTAGLVAMALAARQWSGYALDPVLPLAVLLGGLSGRVAFFHWEQLVALKGQELQRRVQEAVQQAKSDFLNQIAREMRTPVNAVVGVADLLTETGLDGEQRRHLDVFRRSAETLTRLVEDLSDLARIESGRAQLRDSAIALVPLLHEQITHVRAEAEAKGVQIQLTLAKDLPRMVRGDAQRLTQVVSHLLGHAVKVTRQGRIQVEVRPHTRDVNRLRFAFSDTSLSAVTGTLAGILEPFSNSTNLKARKTSGVGLALVRRIADLMGGRLSIRHSPGKGNTVVFSAPLPAVAAAQDGAPLDIGAVPTDLPMLDVPAAVTSVLLVDDNLSTRHLIESMLDKQRFCVVPCANGREALQALEIAPYDVVLMDLHMPEVDGWTALRIIRRLETERNSRRTPVIALGTAPFEAERQRCLDAGFDQHLCKPLRKSRLIESIARVTASPQDVAPPAETTARTGTLRFDQRDSLSLLGGNGLIDVRTAVESLGGDATLYLDAIEHLAPALNNWPARFRETLDRKDFDRARQMAQDMQGILEVVGAAACAESLGRLAEALKRVDDFSAHAVGLDDLDQQIRPLMQTLQTAVERMRVARQDRSRREQGHNSAF